MFGRIIGVVLAILAIAAIGIGCGSSSDDSTGAGGDGTTASETSGGGSSDGGSSDGAAAPVTVSSKSIPKAKYVKEADSICVGVPVEYQGLLGELPKKQQENKEIATPKAAIPPLEKAVEEIAKLGAPNGDKAKAEEVVTSLEAAIHGLEEEPKGELSGPKSDFVEFNKITEAMGFKSCSTL